jgi:DNA-binding YbaB/EbfC family protein
MAEEPKAPMPDMGSLLDMAMGLQQQLAEAQQLAAEAIVEGQSGGGAVRIAVSGSMEFQSVTIAPEAVDPDDVEMLQDLVLAALHDAVEQVEAATRAANPMAAMDLGSLDIGGLAAAAFGGGVLNLDEVAQAEPVDVEERDHRLEIDAPGEDYPLE